MEVYRKQNTCRSADYIQFQSIYEGLHNQGGLQKIRRSTEYREVYRIQGGLQNTGRPTEYTKVSKVLEVLQNTGRYTLYRIHAGLQITFNSTE